MRSVEDWDRVGEGRGFGRGVIDLCSRTANGEQPTMLDLWVGAGVPRGGHVRPPETAKSSGFTTRGGSTLQNLYRR
eukprot:188395-Prymnesium_polylepis.1